MATQVVISSPPTGPLAPVEEAKPVVTAVAAPVVADPAAAAVAPVRPEWLPEKFWDGNVDTSNAKMAKAYGELEKKLGAPKDPPVVDPAAPKADDAEKVLESKGLSFDKYAETFAKDGKLADTDYVELEKSGIPRSMVDAYIAGQNAIASNTTATLFETAGGEEKYGEMTLWAATNLSPAEVKAYNATMDSGDVNAATLAIKGLRTAYETKNGTPPTRVLAGDTGQATATVDIYGSWAQVSAAMKDPRYTSDPAYRKVVADKLDRSNI